MENPISVYNNVLSLGQKSYDITLMEILLDNKSLSNALKRLNIEFESNKEQETVNHLIASHASLLTLKRRYGGIGEASFRELAHNMTMYPSIKFFTFAQINEAEDDTSDSHLLHE